MHCFFVSDLHGRRGRYEALLDAMQRESPQAVFLGGDLLPMDLDLSWADDSNHRDFISDFLAPAFRRELDRMETRPRVLPHPFHRCEGATPLLRQEGASTLQYVS